MATRINEGGLYEPLTAKPITWLIPVGVGIIGSILLFANVHGTLPALLAAIPAVLGSIGGFWARYIEDSVIRQLRKQGCERNGNENMDAQQSAKRIWDLAFFDELTGLSNRARFNIKLDEFITFARRYDQEIGLLLIDLDGFKLVNDSLGHNAGDQFLREVAKRLVDTVREVDFVARLGGDEFCIVLSNISDDYSPAYVAAQCLKSFQKPVRLGARNIYPRASIGIALFPQHGKTVENLFQCADSAIYAAKKAGKHRYSFYDKNLTVLAKQRLNLENDLRGAVERGEFELHYQPQISLETGRIVAVEALIRWHHIERGFIPPDTFIPIAEKIGLISSLGEWVLYTACRQMAEWRRSCVPVSRVAVNISASHFNDKTLAGTLVDVLAETGIGADELEVEITESVVQTTEESLDSFKAVKSLGITVAIDDFGTGYSCLGSLTRLPIDCLKIDKVFIQNALSSGDNSAIVATIISMSRALGFSVVAEGIETLEQVEYLRGVGCPVGQGYFFSKPVKADQIAELAAFDFFRKADETYCESLSFGGHCG